MRRRNRPSGRVGFKGQTLVEFALILPIFFLLLFGLVDVGRFVYMHSTLSQATREAARLVSVEAYWVGRGTPGPTFDPSCNQTGGPVCPADVATLKAHALAAANRMMAPFGSIPAASLYVRCDATPPTGTWADQPSTCASPPADSLASVRALLSIQPITPIINRFIPSVSSAASATMVIN